MSEQDPPVVALDDYSQAFLTLVRQGNTAEAVDKLRGSNMLQALYSCAQLDQATRNGLLTACGANALNDRPAFALKVVSELRIPSDKVYSGVNTKDPDYHVARVFIVSQLDRNPDKKGVQAVFYPEYTGTPRDRMRQAALDHAGLDRWEEKQVVFFSLCGHFGWKDAAASTNRWTTCGLFVRACLFAAGCRAIAWRGVGADNGTDPCIGKPDRQQAWVPTEKCCDRRPSCGDVFHIRGAPYHIKQKKRMPDGTVQEVDVLASSDHVGVILSHTEHGDDWEWDTVEGGQGGGYSTEHPPARTVKLAGGTRMMGSRRLIGWMDLGQLIP